MTLMVAWLEEHIAYTKSLPTNARCSNPEQVEEEDLKKPS